MVQVTELGYLTLGVKRLARWKEFAAGVLGLEVVEVRTRAMQVVRVDRVAGTMREVTPETT